MTWRSAGQRVALRLVGVVAALLRLTGKRAGVVIAYHAVRADRGDIDAGLVPSRDAESFGRELKFLADHFELVSAASVLNAVKARRRFGRFPVCVTLDDDLPEHLEFALPVLNRQRAPAAFFLSGNVHQVRWWELLERAVDASSLADVSRQLGVTRNSVQPRPADIRELAERISRLPPDRRTAIERDLARMTGQSQTSSLGPRGVARLAGAGVEVGFHTLGHFDLTGLTGPELEQALSDGRDELAAAAGQPIRAIAYPHGRADSRVAAAASAARYAAGFTLEPRAATPATDPLLIGRLLTDRLSSTGIAIRVALMLIRAPA